MSKLQDLAQALGEKVDGVRIVEHTTYTPGADEAAEISTITVERNGQTAGFLTETSPGRYSFTAPDDAKFNDVAPIIAVLDDEKVKLGAAE